MNHHAGFSFLYLLCSRYQTANLLPFDLYNRKTIDVVIHCSVCHMFSAIRFNFH